MQINVWNAYTKRNLYSVVCEMENDSNWIFGKCTTTKKRENSRNEKNIYVITTLTISTKQTIPKFILYAFKIINKYRRRNKNVREKKINSKKKIFQKNGLSEIYYMETCLSNRLVIYGKKKISTIYSSENCMIYRWQYFHWI